jgi:DNA-binding MurR/RpiR family transcriptional regulator
MVESITARIKNAKLTKKERSVIEKITREIEKTAFLSGVQLAEACGVSSTFITRLVQKLGYDKFTDFKNELEGLYKKTTSPYDMFQHFIAGSNNYDVIKNSIVQDMKNISNMEKMLDLKTLDKAVTCIVEGKTVYLAAIFASEIAVHALGHYLQRLGKPHIRLTGVGLSKKIEYSDIGEGDVLIAISSQRILKEVLHAAVFAKEKGAVTIAVTDNSANPLAYACDYVLLAPVKGVAIDYTHTATLAMVNLIVNCIAARTPELVAENLEKDDQKWGGKDLFCL